ncbi:hypothetical protein Agub_g12094 [Astrephomene gubernaculifera]|uniref:Uncharacterized protein n=1 Tax=Astrephomene gubernaculifera TaxID=47775 RepID=A0AAD3HRK8_9CHLO|nr:hypothetical protein Agub_g12094 [Astrephomene gubernaculifera]
MLLTVLTALALLNIAATAGELDTSTLNKSDNGHPFCSSSLKGVQPYAREIVDLTQALQTAHGIPDGACLFNPALIRVGGNVFSTFVRVYVAADKERRCVPGQFDRAPFMDDWNGTQASMLAVLRIRRKQSGGTQTTLMGHRYFNINYEDGRLFRDNHGRMFIYLAVPFGAFGDVAATANTVYRVYITCRRLPNLLCDAKLGPPRLLRYDKSLAWEKNWVPWNGTTLMSYPQAGSFGPHSVFNWSSYTEPIPHTRFTSVANQTFFSVWQATFGKLIELAGGTPAILEPSRESYLAVGHLRVHPGCLHPHSISGLGKLVGTDVKPNCTHMLALPKRIKLELPFRPFTHGHADGNTSSHYLVDFAFFFYRFSAFPPYNVTHLSHGILPPSEGHVGIAFPSGLERLEDDYILSYGDADQAARLLFLEQRDIDALLIPLPDMLRDISSFSVCTLPLAPAKKRAPGIRL